MVIKIALTLILNDVKHLLIWNVMKLDRIVDYAFIKNKGIWKYPLSIIFILE